MFPDLPALSLMASILVHFHCYEKLSEAGTLKKEKSLS
jgi:hypothetical protein